MQCKMPGLSDSTALACYVKIHCKNSKHPGLMFNLNKKKNDEGEQVLVAQVLVIQNIQNITS